VGWVANYDPYKLKGVLKMIKPKILVIVGSRSDLEVMSKCEEMLAKFRIPYKLEISSAHRNPQNTVRLAETAEKKGYKLIICGAGMAAHLPGVVASHTTLPVIGVPLVGKYLSGLDSLLSMAQMPAGVPVATVSLGEAGAKNAAILAGEILSLTDKNLKRKIEKFKRELKKR
jgi:phosphoribosylaminoimidazole carboxylase PurE protein